MITQDHGLLASGGTNDPHHSLTVTKSQGARRRAPLKIEDPGYTYCAERLAKIGVSSTFGFEDIIEDVDGFLLAEKMRSNVPITTALREHYEKIGGVSRFRDFLAKRFSNEQATAEDAAYYILTALVEPIINLGRDLLEWQTGGVDIILSHTLPDDLLTRQL